MQRFCESFFSDDGERSTSSAFDGEIFFDLGVCRISSPSLELRNFRGEFQGSWTEERNAAITYKNLLPKGTQILMSDVKVLGMVSHLDIGA